ncbi:hypothetical protein [Lacrimispora sp.]|uniref:hypothetical protein n=1 Tax=Lacrimispora sp. TaxID=2719234 RepID=UPI0028B1C6EB|nr:hypothetical protein [Lacrimispora sp.]
MQDLKSKISTGYAIYAAFMNYLENETVSDTLMSNPDLNVFYEEYDKNYTQLEKTTEVPFIMIDTLLNSLRVIHDLESELFYRIGIHDGISIHNGDFVFQNLGGTE